MVPGEEGVSVHEVPMRRIAITDELKRRFWQKVFKGVDCWRWNGLKNRNGYGLICTSRRLGRQSLRRAHRVSWLMHFGQIPDGLCVLHRCDNPQCCRPDHLFL